MVFALLDNSDKDDLEKLGLNFGERKVVLHAAALLRLEDRSGSACTDELRGSAARTPQKRLLQKRLLSGTPATVAGASAWFKAENGKIVLGPGADVALFRKKAGVLAVEGGFQVGSAVGDEQCASDADAGLLRWLTSDGGSKATLQVCSSGAKWESAGGAGVLDAADNPVCGPETKGALRWDDDLQQLSCCDGVDAWRRVAVSDPATGVEADALALRERAGAAPPAAEGLGTLFVKPVMSFAAGSPLAGGLVSYYKMDAGNFDDAVGNNDGVASGDASASAAGKIGVGGKFDGPVR